MGAKSRRDQPIFEEKIDATLADSFPASDPPSWTLGRDRNAQEEIAGVEISFHCLPGHLHATGSKISKTKEGNIDGYN